MAVLGDIVVVVVVAVVVELVVTDILVPMVYLVVSSPILLATKVFEAKSSLLSSLGVGETGLLWLARALQAATEAALVWVVPEVLVFVPLSPFASWQVPQALWMGALALLEATLLSRLLPDILEALLGEALRAAAI